MITARNEFETVPAFEILTARNSTARETTFELIKVLDTVQHHVDCKEYYRELAELQDDAGEGMFTDIQEQVVEHINYYMPLLPYCTVRKQDGVWIVLPTVEDNDDLLIFAETPEKWVADYILVINDHGNITLRQWEYGTNEYVEIWGMV